MTACLHKPCLALQVAGEAAALTRRILKFGNLACRNMLLSVTIVATRGALTALELATCAVMAVVGARKRFESATKALDT